MITSSVFHSMQYKFVTNKENYEQLASGSVLYSAPHQTAFPVRLASEILQRCFSLLEAQGKKGPYTLYDPCCGTGYLLTTLGVLHAPRLKKIYASDINADILVFAKKNLGLLSKQGLQTRIQELQAHIDAYQKQAHIDAKARAESLAKLLKESDLIEIETFAADITSDATPLTNISQLDIIITDIPYGNLVEWQGSKLNPLSGFFRVVAKLAQPGTIVAVIADKTQRLETTEFVRRERFTRGKRQICLFQAEFPQRAAPISTPS